MHVHVAVDSDPLPPAIVPDASLIPRPREHWIALSSALSIHGLLRLVVVSLGVPCTPALSHAATLLGGRSDQRGRVNGVARGAVSRDGRAFLGSVLVSAIPRRTFVALDIRSGGIQAVKPVPRHTCIVLDYTWNDSIVSPGGNQISCIFSRERSRERLVVTRLRFRPEELVESDKVGPRLLADYGVVIAPLSTSAPIAAEF